MERENIPTVYIYEYIRTRGYEPLHFEEHYRHLAELSHKFQIFPIEERLPREVLRQHIVERLKRAGYAPTATNALCVKIPPFGKEPEIEVEEIFYNDFALRAVHPQGHILYVNGEFITHNTSARMALIDFERTISQDADEGVAIWVNDKKEVIAIDGADVVAVFDDKIIFSSHSNSIECEMVYERVAATRRDVLRGSIYEADLTQAKEVLGIDYRGIVALESFDMVSYTDITAEKIASIVNSAEAL